MSASRIPAVAVIVPAFDAAATLDETLCSVRAQTFRDLEIIVVDDGSRDETPDIVLRHAQTDSRVRLVRQPNSGVAAARNRGINEARAALVAPVDADDLWHPCKIERQVRTMEAVGPPVALVYTWFALINEAGRILGVNRPGAEGNVFPLMCLRNVVGNGSSTLMRRAAVLEVGGYDASLRARNAQGCEDYKLYLQLAERYRFAVVREALTGYRYTPSNMSSDLMQMLRSFDLVTDEFRRRYPERAAEFHTGRNDFLRWSLGRALASGQRRNAAKLAAEAMRFDCRSGALTMLRVPAALCWRTAAPVRDAVLAALGPSRRANRGHFIAGCGAPP